MDQKSLLIPVRTSSKKAIEDTRLQLKKSRADLKRKLSKVSFEREPIAYRKLRMEEIDVQLEEERLHKSWLDLEREQRQVTDNDHRKEHRETNKRIVSLGNDLWAEQEELRRQEEKEGRVLKLGSDTKGAFIQALLALYKDPRVSKKRFSITQSHMKETAIRAYEAGKDAPFKGKIWCCITQCFHDQVNVHAAHIVPHALGPELVDYIFGSGSGSRLDTADNCLLIHEYVERAFDNGSFVLLPVDASETPILRWKVQITNLSAINTDMGRGTLKDLDGKEVSFKNDNRPASRFLYYHFVVTLLRNKRDRQPGWEKILTELPTGKPFATMGRYMRDSMLLTLAKNAGDLNATEEARILGGEGGETFVEQEKLTDIEETEVARRVLETHEPEDEDEDEDEE